MSRVLPGLFQQQMPQAKALQRGKPLLGLSSKRGTGFTLVEVLVALGIFAILSTGYLIASGDAVRGVGRVQDKMIALWVAEDAITKLRTLDAEKAKPFVEQKITFLERDWTVSFEQEETSEETLSRVQVFVTQTDESEALATLETYFLRK